MPSNPLDDPATWAGLLQAHVPSLYCAVSRRVGADRALAEDLVQEAWLRAVDTWRARGVPRDPGAWLQAVAANLVRAHFRRLRATALEHEPEARGVEPREGAGREHAALLQWGLARLPRASAELVAARHLDGRTLAELAREARTTERAIEGRLHRARAKLARILAPRGVPADLLADEPNDL